MAENAAGGNNRMLYSIIGVLVGIVAVGAFAVFGGLLNSEKIKPAAPAVVAQKAPPDPAPAPPSATSEAERNTLAASIDRAITTGDFTYADRLLADANRSYSGNSAWPPLQQRLARARADHDTQLRRTEARRLIAEARRFAQIGDFSDAEAMLQEADKQVPGLAETGQARGDIAAMRTARGQLYRERYQFQAAIDQAFTADRLWEAERLLAEYFQRFSQDDEYRARADRLAQMRAASTWQARVNQSRNLIGNARQAMDRGDFVEAERQLVLADQSAPGFPEVNQARADLSRRRIAAEQQQDGVRLILSAIDAAFQRRQYDDAERAIEEGRRRYGSYAGWADLQRRAANARQGNEQQANELRLQNAHALELVTAARRSTAQGDFAAAERVLNEASRLSTQMPEVAIARAELERAKADRARHDAEIRATTASVDAALARQQYADAERLIADGAKRYPSYGGWADLSRRLAENRRMTPNPTSTTPLPAQPAPAQTLPAVPSRPTVVPPPATASAPPPNAATAPAANPQLPQLIAAARDAIKRSDFIAADAAVTAAERLDAKASSVVEVRAELKAAQEKKTSPAAAAASPQPPANVPSAPLAPATPPANTRDAATHSTPMAGLPTPPVTPAPNATNVPAANARLPELVAAAHDAIKRSDFPAAEKAVVEAERLDAKAAPVAEVRAELKAALDKSKTPPAPAATAAPSAAVTPPAMPAAASPPANSKGVPASASAAPSATAPAPPVDQQLQQLIAAARDATKRSDFAAAEKAVADTEKLDARATSVVEVRADLKAARLRQLVGETRHAIKRSDLAAAEKAVAEAEKLDAKAASVVEVRAELKVVKLVGEARDAIKRSDFAAAEKAVAETEKVDAKAASKVRAELTAAEGKSKEKIAPADRK
jgi:hypothetical protein